MSKTIVIKLSSLGNKVQGPFDITDNLGNVVATNVTIQTLIVGFEYLVNDAAVSITLKSNDDCNLSITTAISFLTIAQINAITLTYVNTGSLWRHLTDIINYNKYYGVIRPYIIEYPFYYQNQDQILQNIKDFTTAYKYLPIIDGVFNDSAKVQTDDQYFNKAILYNGQQCTGMLNLVPKPMRNLQSYNSYPKYNTDSKTIIFTKSDSFYQYNIFWSIVKNKSLPLFNTSCESLSIDKVLNQTNMDYGVRSFKKDTLRAKSLLVRHILDNKSDAHLVSQFILSSSMISYK
jgi:hypothetical protein